jgi:peptide-methionine (R)-S-oxide reductase
MTTPKTTKTDAEWREQLTPEQYHILREQGTERPWTSEFLEVKGDGMFHCAGCGAALFSTDTKYESGSGWPSFYEPAVAEAVEVLRDTSHGMIRTEVRCANCGGHLGHVFEDGPQPTGLRYCINGCALDLQQD